MAGQGNTRGSRRSGRSARGERTWPVPVAASAAGSSSSTGTAQPSPTAGLTETGPKATYRMLLVRGLTPVEAANLTAFTCGIPVAKTGWSIGEVNRLLFLRELNRTGHFDLYDRATQQAR